MKYIFGFFIILVCGSCFSAAEVYLEPKVFVNNAFNGEVPKMSKMYLSKDIKTEVEKILSHKTRVLKFKYWKNSEKSVWILEEIGKVHPITTGYVVNKGAIEDVKVLIYRESRGWEVKYPRFTKQFNGAKLSDFEASKMRVNGISGATLSVRALTKLAHLSLFLDSKVM